MRDIWARVAPDTRVALVAIGGYGRRQMSPASDVDLMVLHAGGRRSAGVRAAASALFYPLWDAGLTVGHSTRTPKEALAVARTDFDAETAFLDARLVAGDRELFEDFEAAALRRSRSDARGFAERLREATLARLTRAGDASIELEPHLRDGRGALRDLHAIAWLARIAGEQPPTLDAAADLLHRVRNELHLVTGRHSDVLLRQLQRQIASALAASRAAPSELLPSEGVPAPEDALMRALYGRCRTIAFTLDGMLDGPPAGVPALEPSGDRWTQAERRAFLELLARGEDGRRAFRALEQSGALERALPEWSAVRCLPQRNVYHRFPVDAHAFQTVVAAAALEASTDDLVRRVTEDAAADRDELLLAALLHDIGKGREEDHSIRGERLARQAVDRMAVAEPAASEIVWLVRHHLLLVDTATRRDLEDESIVVEMAEDVDSLRRLRLLFLLSVADGVATGPAAWTPWKAGLVADLFLKVGRVLETGELVGAEVSELARMRSAELRAALRRFPREHVDRHLAAMPRQWLLSQSVESLIRQAALMIEPGEGELRVHSTPSGDPHVWEVTVVARDRPGLFSKISGSLALHGLNVLFAQAYTRADGAALEVFRAESVDEDGDRLRRVAEDASGALHGSVSLAERLAAKRSGYARARRTASSTPRVVVDDRVSDFATVIEVHAADHIGLLFEITDALAALELDIHIAKIATYGEDVVDVFYVRDLDGQKVGSRAGAIERSLLERLRETETPA